MHGRTVLADTRDGIVRGPRLTCMRAFTDGAGCGVRMKGSEPLSV